MTNAERKIELERIRALFQREVLRSGAPLKPEKFDELWRVLSFNPRYREAAQNAVDVLLGGGLQQAEYETAETELNVVLGQAISELERSLSPPPPGVADPNSGT